MNAALNPAGTRITPPADFPVIWDQPGDEGYHWTRDREHCPQPITPMFTSVAALTASAGRRPTVAEYDEAILGRYDVIVHGYNYTRVAVFDGSPEEVAERAARNRQKLIATCSRLQALWENEWRPELEELWDFWAQFDLERASLPDLAAHLEATLARATQLYAIHYRMGPPMWFALDEFEKFFCDLFPGTTPLEAHRLLQGFDNKTLQIGRSLWQLSRWAAAIPRVRQALEELPAEQVLPALAALPEGKAFTTQLDVFLRTYGRRSSLWDWGYPSWEEEPAPVINHLKLHLAQPDRDLEAELRATAGQRRAAVAEARQALLGYPQPVVDRFESLLQAAQVALVLTEDHTYYIDFNGFAWVRRVIREVGKRLASLGRLEQVNDVFFLTIQELQAGIADDAQDLSGLAVPRRLEAQLWSSYSEPQELGTRPAVPQSLYSPDARRMLCYLGGWVAEEELPHPVEAGVLHGQPGSSGKVIGRARLILSLAEADRLQPGDILVTITTAPPWTPLFLSAAGLVTDAGGLLSHGAVVSREYRLPAVVGTQAATSWLHDGQLIEVDGDRGTVRVLEA